MTDSPQDNSKVGRTVDRDVFARFLNALSPDTQEASNHYTRLHAKLVGFFSLKGLSDPVRDADETIDRAALKIAGGAIVPEVDKYCFGIARNVARESLRRDHRESAAFLKSIENPQNSADEQVKRIDNLLQPCFEQLTVDEQQLLQDYCRDLPGRARSVHRRQLAANMNTTVLALRMRVTRLRTKLTDCLQQRSKE
jgi:DNA-directed RNA polymerase specialized sigma24 family protein